MRLTATHMRHAPLRLTVHFLLHNINNTDMRISTALETSTTGSTTAGAATSGTPATRCTTTLTCMRALRDDVHGRCGLFAQGQINTSVQCVRILSKSNARGRWQTK